MPVTIKKVRPLAEDEKFGIEKWVVVAEDGRRGRVTLILRRQGKGPIVPFPEEHIRFCSREAQQEIRNFIAGGRRED
jgi:hypothetical protein